MMMTTLLMATSWRQRSSGGRRGARRGMGTVSVARRNGSRPRLRRPYGSIKLAAVDQHSTLPPPPPAAGMVPPPRRSREKNKKT